MSGTTKVFFMVGESTIASLYKNGKRYWQGEKKKKLQDSIKISSNHSFSRLFHTTEAGTVAEGFVGKISAPELLPSQFYVVFFAVLERYSS